MYYNDKLLILYCLNRKFKTTYSTCSKSNIMGFIKASTFKWKPVRTRFAHVNNIVTGKIITGQDSSWACADMTGQLYIVHVDDQWPWHSTSVVHFVQYIWCSLSKMKNYVLKWHLFTEQLFWSHVHPVHFYVSLYVRFYTCLFFSCVNAPRSPGAQIPSQPPLTLVKFIRKSEKKSTIFENEECIHVQTSLILVYRMLIYFGNLMGHKLMYM